MNGHMERCVEIQLGDKDITDMPAGMATEPQRMEEQEKTTTERYRSIIMISR